MKFEGRAEATDATIRIDGNGAAFTYPLYIGQDANGNDVHDFKGCFERAALLALAWNRMESWEAMRTALIAMRPFCDDSDNELATPFDIACKAAFEALALSEREA